MEDEEGGSIGVADYHLAARLTTTSMDLLRRRAEGIAVAVIGAAAGFAHTPIPQ